MPSPRLTVPVTRSILTDFACASTIVMWFMRKRIWISVQCLPDRRTYRLTFGHSVPDAAIRRGTGVPFRREEMAAAYCPPVRAKLPRHKIAAASAKTSRKG